MITCDDDVLFSLNMVTWQRVAKMFMMTLKPDWRFLEKRRNKDEISNIGTLLRYLKEQNGTKKVLYSKISKRLALYRSRNYVTISNNLPEIKRPLLKEKQDSFKRRKGAELEKGVRDQFVMACVGVEDKNMVHPLLNS